MRSGLVPASSSRNTRCVSTCVLPVPALALTQTEAPRIGGVALSAPRAGEVGSQARCPLMATISSSSPGTDHSATRARCA